MLKRLFVSFLILVISLIVVLPLEVSAKTRIIKKKSCNYKVQVKTVFDFKDRLAKEQSDQLIVRWSDGIDNVWNNKTTSQGIKNGCSIDYYFDLVKLTDDQTCKDYSDYHCIGVVSDFYNQRHNIADATIVKANSNRNSWGEWTTRVTGEQAAHEVGHMMGLAEEYHYLIKDDQKIWVNDNYIANGPQSIMAKTWGEVVALKEHSYQILQKAGYRNLQFVF